MNYDELKMYGKMVATKDWYVNGIYSNTNELWVLDDNVYMHEEHPNKNTYTGETCTYYVGKVDNINGLLYSYDFN